MIPQFLVLDVDIKICQAQVCSSIRGCHATFLVKNTLFKGEVAWQPLKELQICSSSILDPPTRAFKWDIVCLSTIITFEEIRGYVKKCLFLLNKIKIVPNTHLKERVLWIPMRWGTQCTNIWRCFHVSSSFCNPPFPYLNPPSFALAPTHPPIHASYRVLQHKLHLSKWLWQI